MRNIKECLRLKLEAGLSHEKIARALQLSKGVVSKYVTAARVAGLGWPALVAMDEAALAAALFAPMPPGKPRGERVLPDVLSIHRELRRKGVTLQLLWEEYLAAHAGQPTYRYTQFVEHYRRYAQTLKRSMRSCTARARSCLSTMPARRCRWSIQAPAKSAGRTSSSPPWAPRITPMPARRRAKPRWTG